MLTDIKQKIAQSVAPELGVDSSDIFSLFELPKQLAQGHIALPVFRFAKALKKAPPAIASDLEKLNVWSNLPELSNVQATGGFLNFCLSEKYSQDLLLATIRSSGEKLGYTDLGQGKNLLIDFSSPNVAKPMSIGHLRATIIGQAISNLARTQGYKVTGVNHLGDWGVQFGKLAWAYQNWGADYSFEEKPFDSLFEIYVRFHREAESNPELNEAGAETFRRLEAGDEKVTEIWQMFLKVSLKEYQKLYDRLGVHHELVRGESFYNDLLKPTEDRLEKAGLLVESEGAMVVELDGMPPCLIRKSDGASLYATRDLACAIHRKEELKADLNLYVVGMDQNLHFQQVFSVLEKMGYDWSKDCHHISFGMYRFKEGRMSTRKGNVIFLDDVLNKSVDLVKKIIEEKNPDLENKEKVAEQVGVGAIIFNDLINDRVRNVDFDWDRILDFEGASGPYVQYCQVRCNSLIKKYGKEIDGEMPVALTEDAERELIRLLLVYPDFVQKSFSAFKPNFLAQYLVEVCRAFNHFYQKCRVLGEAADVESSRMALVFATRQVLRQGLAVLNIESPEAM